MSIKIISISNIFFKNVDLRSLQEKMVLKSGLYHSEEELIYPEQTVPQCQDRKCANDIKQTLIVASHKCEKGFSVLCLSDTQYYQHHHSHTHKALTYSCGAVINVCGFLSWTDGATKRVYVLCPWGHKFLHQRLLRLPSVKVSQCVCLLPT